MPRLWRQGSAKGWSRDKQLDLNTATKDQLPSLPRVTAAEADRVIAGCPYSEPGDVVTRGIMPKTEYDKIADRVTAKKLTRRQSRELTPHFSVA